MVKEETFFSVLLFHRKTENHFMVEERKREKKPHKTFFFCKLSWLTSYQSMWSKSMLWNDKRQTDVNIQQTTGKHHRFKFFLYVPLFCEWFYFLLRFSLGMTWTQIDVSETYEYPELTSSSLYFHFYFFCFFSLLPDFFRSSVFLLRNYSLNMLLSNQSQCEEDYNFTSS